MNDVRIKNDTAYYTFDIMKLKNRISYLRKLLPGNISLCYAVKANTFIAGELINEVERFEICSPGEAEICEKVGIPAQKTVISGVYKTPEVIETMVASSHGRIYTVESWTQFEQLRDLSERYRKAIPILMRLTNGSQFGIEEGELEKMVAEAQRYPYLQILGIQFFSGTQKTSLKKLKREVEHLDALLIKLRGTYGFTAQELEYGPGLPVGYFEDEPFDEEAFFRGFGDILRDMHCQQNVILELGRSIAASCGRYYTHVVDMKHNKGQNYAIVDGGMHHLVYFGQHMAMRQPLFCVCGKEDETKNIVYNICGSLCSMNDMMVKQAAMPKLEIGDTLCFENAGAYCMTEGISLFLSRELPAVYLVRENGKVICVRKTFETSILNTPNRKEM